MTLKKTVYCDLIEVVKNGTVQVRTKTEILENDIEISSSLHRHIVTPGSDYSSEDTRVQSICKAVHTADVVAAYKAAQAKIAQPE